MVINMFTRESIKENESAPMYREPIGPKQELTDEREDELDELVQELDEYEEHLCDWERDEERARENIECIISGKTLYELIMDNKRQFDDSFIALFCHLSEHAELDDSDLWTLFDDAISYVHIGDMYTRDGELASLCLDGDKEAELNDELFNAINKLTDLEFEYVSRRTNLGIEKNSRFCGYYISYERHALIFDDEKAIELIAEYTVEGFNNGTL